MRRSALLALPALVVGCALVAGCAAKPAPGPTVTRDFGPKELVLRVDVVPGMLPDASMLARLPTVSVYGGGQVLTPAPQPAIYPGPALPALQVQQITPADVRHLVDLASRSGVGSGQDLGTPAVADAPTTHFTLRTNTGVATTTVLALGMVDDRSLTPSQRAGRAALRDLVAALSDLRATLGSVPAAVPFEPSGVVAVAHNWTDPHDASVPPPPPVAWPGPALPGTYVGMGLTCVTASGSAGAAVMAAAAHANALTPWMFEGSRWTLFLRPLLPDETGCGDLAH
jgi:hypothetical protein